VSVVHRNCLRHRLLIIDPHDAVLGVDEPGVRQRPSGAKLELVALARVEEDPLPGDAD
jgi:hypothetical protein